MADIKTNLSELSVLVGIKVLCDNENEILSSLEFYTKVMDILPSTLHGNISNLNLLEFNTEQIQLVKNGYKLAKLIKEQFLITSISSLKWFGYDTQKEDPADIAINDIKFSLKADSFILENMGLYKLVNLFTGSNYPRGLHIFKQFSSSEYIIWFETTWNLMIDYLRNNSNNWGYIDDKRTVSITLNKSNVVFKHNSESLTLPTICNLVTFESLTSSTFREQIFSKFINSQLSKNTVYVAAKKACSIMAAEKLVSLLKENLDYTSGLPRFFRVHDESYYYAKSTDYEQKIYTVPSKTHFRNEIKIESIKYEIPESQVNIITTFKNTSNGKTLVIRNECRFSHGQLNGTPEAKMYYNKKDKESSLDTIYQEYNLL